ncbi:hypothetical protein L1987_70508 [Smallanthus sonchifolius]|uniref:Uncharacterized protein n=1 Tax=Smallanthus sonchifolius TaxID=185202 RepID=A0ACB9AP20_9ASTR|nr:hypothetical protein L1987_70508 [Smallanthus sonchifolius]
MASHGGSPPPISPSSPSPAISTALPALNRGQSSETSTSSAPSPTVPSMISPKNTARSCNSNSVRKTSSLVPPSKWRKSSSKHRMSTLAAVQKRQPVSTQPTITPISCGPRTGPTGDKLDLISTVSLNVISRMVLGKRYLDESENSVVSPDEFRKMLDEWFLLNGVLNIGDSIPWIAFLDLQGYVKRMKVVSKKFDRFLEHVLDEHNGRRTEEGERFVATDMVDLLLHLADDPNLDVKLERHELRTRDLLAGGTEGSSVTLEWAISEMLKKPEIFQKATEELDRVIGKNRWVQEKDMPNLPYIEAIVFEVMRLHPVAPMLVPRRAREDCKVAGYDITEGTQVFVSV